ncbi:MAG: ABC transporter ATP-binding protein [Fervidicoccaceae archaeon]
MRAKPLEIRGLRVEYLTLRGWTTVVEDVDLDVEVEDEVLAVVGESGCGKTTLGLAVAGLLPPNSRARGSIKIRGREVSGRRGSARVAMIFQDALASLNPVMTVGEQIAEVFVFHEGDDKRGALEKAKRLLREVGLPEDFAGKYPHELSGGQRQRVMIAIVLALRPDLVVADEPTTALDVTVQAKVLTTLRETVKRNKIPMIYITHDLALAIQASDRIAVMYAGQVVELSDKFGIFEDPLHPYTKALLGAIPRVDADVAELQAIEGEPPLPGDFPPGCRFHPRCPRAFEKCKREAPQIISVNGRLVRCHLYG